MLQTKKVYWSFTLMCWIWLEHMFSQICPIFVRYCGCCSTFNPVSLQGLCPPPAAASGVVSESLSLPSYKDYPVHRPFINTLVHHTPQTHTHQSCRSSSPSKAFPETSSAGNFHLCVFVCTKFPCRSCSVTELHGYSMCNMMPHYLSVSAAPTSIHSFTLSSLSSSNPPILPSKPKNHILLHHD